MSDSVELNENKPIGVRLNDLGWEQGSVALLPMGSTLISPAIITVNPGEYLIVCTQTCSLLEHSAEKEPFVEVMIGIPLSNYDPNADAAKGKNNTHFYLKFSEGQLLSGQYAAIDCCLARRAFIPKIILFGLERCDVDCTQIEIDSFKAWLASYYLRVAIPDNLVHKMRMGSSSSSFREGARKKMKGRVQSGQEAFKGIRTCYINWNPNSEVCNGNYNLKIMIVCDDKECKDLIERNLTEFWSDYLKSDGKNGIFLSYFEVRMMDDVTLAEIDGMFRCNLWDSLSSLGERYQSLTTE